MTRGERLLRTLVIAILGLVFFLPLWWVTVSALRPPEDIFAFLSP